MKILEPLARDQYDSANAFAREMVAQIESYFSFLLYPDQPEFLPIYWVASFLCPVYRFTITSEEMPVVRAYLERKFSVVNCTVSCLIYEGKVSPLVADPSPAPSSNNNIRFVLPGGLSCLSDGFSQTLVRNESERSIRDKIDKDLETYIRAADSHLAGLQAEAAEKAANDKEEVEIVAKDPLDFWFAQVGVSCFISDLFNDFSYIKESSKNYLTDLPQYAQDICACPPTSVPSERMFSLSGLLSNDRFAAVHPESLENRVLVKANKFV